MSGDSSWGGPCWRCGHPASYHGATFCQVQAGSMIKRQCDCGGYSHEPSAPPDAPHVSSVLPVGQVNP